MIETMKYLNLGCGKKYSNLPEWTNLDFVSSEEQVIAHNLLEGIPFPNDTFDLVYHSHVLEHFSKKDGAKMLSECYNVLKKGGILRIAVPDLEQIARNYLTFLEKGLESPEDELNRANYDWMIIEMYDQTVRNYSGGLMGEYFAKDKIINEDYVYQRIGFEGKNLRKFILNRKKNFQSEPTKTHVSLISLKHKLKNIIKRLIGRKEVNQLKIEMNEYEKLGRFRLGGEIHQWMYDRYALNYILTSIGFNDFQVKTAFDSKIPNWEIYQLDSIGPEVRKPDSLFIEVIK